MGSDANAPRGQVTLCPLSMETCVVRGKPVHVQVEVEGEAQVTTTVTPHSIIVLRAETSVRRGKPLWVLAEALGGIPRTQPLPPTPGHDWEGMDVGIVAMVKKDNTGGLQME